MEPEPTQRQPRWRRRLSTALLVLIGGLATLGASCEIDVTVPDCSARMEEHAWIPTSDVEALGGPEAAGFEGLRAFVVRPLDVACKMPTVLVLTPYDIEMSRQLWMGEYNDEFPLFASRNYAFVFADWRGFYASADAAYEGAPPAGEDGRDVINWIAAQSWSNGMVGTYGASALASGQYETIVTWDPEDSDAQYAAAVPIFNSFVPTYKQFFPGGVFRREYAWCLDSVGWGAVLDHVVLHPNYDRFWEYVETAKRDASEVDVPMLLVGGWWDHHDMFETLDLMRRESDPSVREEHRLIVGPWTHLSMNAPVNPFGLSEEELQWADTESTVQLEALAFFDHHLRGLAPGNGASDRIRVFQVGEETWEGHDDWPPPTQGMALSFTAQGELVPEGQDVGAGSVSWTYRPTQPSPSYGGDLMWSGPVWWCSSDSSWSTDCHPEDVDSLSYFHGPTDQRPVMDWGELGLGSPHIWLTDPLDAPLAIQGRIRAELSVSTDQIDTDFAIRVVDASPDGTLLLLGTAVRRLQTRNGFRAEDRAPAEPGKVYPLEIQLTSTLAYTIPVGHRLGLIVSSSDYPRYDVNPNQGGELMHVVDIFEFEDVELVSVDAQNTLHVGAATPSRLVVPHR